MPDIRKEVESLLFSSGRTMTEKDLSDIIGARPADVRKALDALKKDYDERDTSLTLMDTGNGWKMNVKEKYVSLVTKIVADTELPFPVLETLSVIAYKAPAIQAEVIDARGTNAYEHIQGLIEGGFVERRKKGRSFELGLTQKFFDYFDVEGEKSLKMILKDVKAKEPAKKKLGDLPVVDVPEDGQQLTLTSPSSAGDLAKRADGSQQIAGLEVVPIPERKKQEQFKPDADFLDSIDARLGDVSKRNDSHDQDDLFKKDGEGKDPALQTMSEDYEFEPAENKRNKEIFGEGKKAEESDEGEPPAEASTKEPVDDSEDKEEEPLDF